jgi:hypothetical protein
MCVTSYKTDVSEHVGFEFTEKIELTWQNVLEIAFDVLI